MQALKEHYLTLKLRRLQSSEEWSPGGHGLWFALVKMGQGTYGLGASAWKVTSGDLIVLNLEANGKLTAQNGELLFWEFTSPIEHLLPFCSAEEMCLLQGIWENFRASTIYPASASLAKQCYALAESAPTPGSLDHRTYVLRFAAAVLTLEFINTRTKRNPAMAAQAHLNQVCEELSAAELLGLPINELANKFRCSRRHLSRLFQRQFGCSVAGLRMELRLLKAVALLRNPSAKVFAVAEQCGFNHTGLFNTCFKRRFGQSPGQWQKSVFANETGPAFGPEGGRLPSYAANSCESADESAQDTPLQARKFQIFREMNSDALKTLPVPTNGRCRGNMSSCAHSSR
jgi:AraC-like DNA-binding protein